MCRITNNDRVSIELIDEETININFLLVVNAIGTDHCEIIDLDSADIGNDVFSAENMNSSICLDYAFVFNQRFEFKCFLQFLVFLF